MNRALNILCIDDISADKFAGVDAMLAGMANVARARNLGEALVMLDGQSGTAYIPDLIILLQTYPGQFSAVEVERIRRRAPLARWICVLGTWCEGEARSGRPLPGVMRVYWHQAEAHFRRELAQLHAGRRSSWELPATATDEERLLAVLDEPLPRGTGLIAIHAANRDAAGYLADICRLGGYATVWIDPRRPAKVAGATAAIYDSPALNGSDDDRWELAVVQGFVQAISPAPVFALVSFPRCETVGQLAALGVRAVLSKPIAVPELLWHLGG